MALRNRLRHEHVQHRAAELPASSASHTASWSSSAPRPIFTSPAPRGSSPIRSRLSSPRVGPSAAGPGPGTPAPAAPGPGRPRSPPARNPDAAPPGSAPRSPACRTGAACSAGAAQRAQPDHHHAAAPPAPSHAAAPSAPPAASSAKRGIRFASISSAMIPYSPALAPCAPRLFSSATPSGSQSNGASLSSPAEVHEDQLQLRGAAGNSLATATRVRNQRLRIPHGRARTPPACPRTSPRARRTRPARGRSVVPLLPGERKIPGRRGSADGCAWAGLTQLAGECVQQHAAAWATFRLCTGPPRRCGSGAGRPPAPRPHAALLVAQHQRDRPVARQAAAAPRPAVSVAATVR